MDLNWLFVRGLTREQRHWHRFPETFRRALPGSKVHFLDLPGVGTEILRESPKRMSEIVEDIRARWLPLKAQNPGPWAFLGISLGGMVGMEWASLYPNDLSGLVLLNSSASNLSRFWERLNFFNFPKLVGNGLIKDAFTRERRVIEMTTRLCQNVEEVAGEWAAVSADPKLLSRAFKGQIAAALHFEAPAKLDVPVLVLSSARDNFTWPVCSQRLAEHYQAPHRIHPEAGHDITLDDPEWVTSEIDRWLPKLAGKSRGPLPERAAKSPSL
jgi:pimeloyl-ACP methyl ester carboxylesterase